jgi:hypothetical protein
MRTRLGNNLGDYHGNLLGLLSAEILSLNPLYVPSLQHLVGGMEGYPFNASASLLGNKGNFAFGPRSVVICSPGH